MTSLSSLYHNTGNLPEGFEDPALKIRGGSRPKIDEDYLFHFELNKQGFPASVKEIKMSKFINKEVDGE